MCGFLTCDARFVDDAFGLATEYRAYESCSLHRSDRAPSLSGYPDNVRATGQAQREIGGSEP